MTVAEYEERFRPPAPSPHQMFAEMGNPHRTRRRRRRWLLTAALIAVMMLIIEVGPHHVAHGHAGKGSAREPAFDVLLSDFSHILDSVRNGWTGGSHS